MGRWQGAPTQTVQLVRQGGATPLAAQWDGLYHCMCQKKKTILHRGHRYRPRRLRQIRWQTRLVRHPQQVIELAQSCACSAAVLSGSLRSCDRTVRRWYWIEYLEFKDKVWRARLRWLSSLADVAVSFLPITHPDYHIDMFKSAATQSSLQPPRADLPVRGMVAGFAAAS